MQSSHAINEVRGCCCYQQNGHSLESFSRFSKPNGALENWEKTIFCLEGFLAGEGIRFFVDVSRECYLLQVENLFLAGGGILLR